MHLAIDRTIASAISEQARANARLLRSKSGAQEFHNNVINEVKARLKVLAKSDPKEYTDVEGYFLENYVLQNKQGWQTLNNSSPIGQYFTTYLKSLGSSQGQLLGNPLQAIPFSSFE